MRYVGGKGKIAKAVVEAIRARTLAETIYEPFMGGVAMDAALAPHFDKVLAGDGHEDIALMWQAVLSGWVPPVVTYERYQELRCATEPSAERVFVGAGGRFGGRWFEGFARGGFAVNGEPRNHQAESVRAVLGVRDNMKRGGVLVFHKDYRAWPLDCGEPSVIYCDPPYPASARAKRYAVGFDSADF